MTRRRKFESDASSNDIPNSVKRKKKPLNNSRSSPGIFVRKLGAFGRIRRSTTRYLRYILGIARQRARRYRLYRIVILADCVTRRWRICDTAWYCITDSDLFSRGEASIFRSSLFLIFFLRMYIHMCICIHTHTHTLSFSLSFSFSLSLFPFFLLERFSSIDYFFLRLPWLVRLPLWILLTFAPRFSATTPLLVPCAGFDSGERKYRFF